MAYSNGNPVFVANQTPNNVTVGGITVNSGKAALVTPTDAVAVTLSSGLTGGTPITALPVSALPQAVQAGTVVDISQTISGVAYKDQAYVTTTAAAAATSLVIASYTPSASFTTAATLLTSSQGTVAGFVEAGCAVFTTVVTSKLDVAVSQIEKGAQLALRMSRAVLSANNDTFGVKGL